MQSYWITLTAVALFGGIMGMLSPEGDVKKYVRLTVSLCLICAMVQPIFAIASSDASDWSEKLGLSEEQERMDYDEIYHQALLSGGKEQLEESLKQGLVAELSLPYDSLDIEAVFEMKNDERKLKEIRVLLRDSAIFADPREIVAQINEQADCPCTVIYE